MAKLLIPKLYEDEKLSAAEKVFLAIFEEFVQKAPLVQVYTRIDELPEQALDLLAWQLHIEGYELAQGLEEKRNLIKRAIKLHRYKGTPYAIKEVLRALSLEGQVKEWFEYGGQPYHFRVDILSKGKLIEPETETKLLKLIEEYKNTRSKLEKVSIGYSMGRTSITTAGAFIDSGYEYFAPVVIEENFAGAYTTQGGFIDQGSEVFANG